MNWQSEIVLGERFVDVALHAIAFVTIMLSIALIVAHQMRPRLRQSLLLATLLGLLSSL